MVPPAPTAVATFDAGASTAYRSAAGALVCTMIVAVPLFPSLVAVIVAEPAVTPVTSPVPDTVATAKGPPAHVTSRPESRLPAASFAAAANCTVAPAASVAAAGVTATDATGVAGLVAFPPPPQAARSRLVPMSNQGLRGMGRASPRRHRSPPQGTGHRGHLMGTTLAGAFLAAGCSQGAAVSKHSHHVLPPLVSRSMHTASRTHGFTESVIRGMTRLANEHGAINLAQGFPNFPCPDVLKEAAAHAIRDDVNQYASTWGAKRLRDALAQKYAA